MRHEMIRSSVSIVKGLTPKGVDVSASEKAATIRVRVDHGKTILEIEHNGTTTTHNLAQGDQLELAHTINVNFTQAIEDDHAFPIILCHRGDAYILNRTRNGKLILTK